MTNKEQQEYCSYPVGDCLLGDELNQLRVECDALKSERAGMLDRSSGVIASLRAEVERLKEMLRLSEQCLPYDLPLSEAIRKALASGAAPKETDRG